MTRNAFLRSLLLCAAAPVVVSRALAKPRVERVHVQAFGITTRAQAERLGRFFLHTQKLRDGGQPCSVELIFDRQTMTFSTP